MITTKRTGTIKRLTNGLYRAHRLGVWWLGDYKSYQKAELALDVSTNPSALDSQRGVYDGGVHASEGTHKQAINGFSPVDV